ncbi:formin-like protein 3 isoform X3 [Scophthalmus maximus]|uniref:formin-like protein 3 isoform X3 n=1 Tax=Scophthalmus maximus TaxID=52904 RepID=UPI0015E156EB|nr:formin-like protein 3 isoform X3 [Scophthalmus maximus]
MIIFTDVTNFKSTLFFTSGYDVTATTFPGVHRLCESEQNSPDSTLQYETDASDRPQRPPTPRNPQDSPWTHAHMEHGPPPPPPRSPLWYETVSLTPQPPPELLNSSDSPLQYGTDASHAPQPPPTPANSPDSWVPSLPPEPPRHHSPHWKIEIKRRRSMMRMQWWKWHLFVPKLKMIKEDSVLLIDNTDTDLSSDLSPDLSPDDSAADTNII